MIQLKVPNRIAFLKSYVLSNLPINLLVIGLTLFILNTPIYAQKRDLEYKFQISFISSDSLDLKFQYINQTDPINFKTIKLHKLESFSNNKKTATFIKTNLDIREFRFRVMFENNKAKLTIEDISLVFPQKTINWSKSGIINDFTLTNGDYLANKNNNIEIQPNSKNSILLLLSNVIEFNTTKSIDYILIKLQCNKRQKLSIQYSTVLNKDSKDYPFNTLKTVYSMITPSHDFIEIKVPLPTQLNIKAFKVNYGIDSLDTLRIAKIQFFKADKVATWSNDKILSSFFYNQSVKQQISTNGNNITLVNNGYLELTNPIQWDLTMAEKWVKKIKIITIIILASILLFLLNNAAASSDKLFIK